MFKLGKYLLIISFGLFFSSCISTFKKDKYPEVSYFSELSNQKFSIEPFSCYSTDIKITNDFIIASCLDTSNIRNTKRYIIIYDKQLKEIKRLELESIIEASNNGVLYDFESENLFKYNPPYNKKELINTLKIEIPTSGDIEDKYAELIDENKWKHSSFFVDEITEFTDSIRKNIFKKKYMLNVDCIFQIGHYDYIIKYKNKKDFFIKGNNINILSSILKEYKNCNEYFPSTHKKHKNIRFERFDEITQNYHLTGSNHIAFGISSSGINYYRLKIDNDTLLFKSKTSFDYVYKNSKIIVLKGIQNKYYVIKKK